MWEDERNRQGGKFSIRLRKGLASRYWEDLLLAVIGEQLEVGDEICGVGVSMRYNEDILSVWNKTASDAEAKKMIYAALQKALPIQTTYVEYKAHDDSLLHTNRRKSAKGVERTEDADETPATAAATAAAATTLTTTTNATSVSSVQ
jgi:translation initiation factor 4E